MHAIARAGRGAGAGAAKKITVALVGLCLGGLAAVSIAQRAEVASDRGLLSGGGHDPANQLQPSPILERVLGKEKIVEALCRGECTLAEAAGRFRDLIAADPKAMELLRIHYPGKADEEVFGRNVVSHVRGHRLYRRHADRLEAQLNESLAAGTFRLPADEATPGLGLAIGVR